MALGFKVRKLVTAREYTIEELYEAIKDKQFTAGQPELAKQGMTMIIAFPPSDRNNQVWISPGQMKKAPYSKFTVTRNGAAGAGERSRTEEELVVITCEELQRLGL